jgi:hypothetical protein
LGGGVEFSHEILDVQAVLTKGRADRRGRSGRAAHDLEFDLGNEFFGHTSFFNPLLSN